MLPSIRVASSLEDLSSLAAQRILKIAEDALVTTGRFVLALSGGSTPQPLYRLLAEQFAARIPWDKTHVLFTDERCVSPDHPDSNFGMACRLLLDHVEIPYGQIHRIAGEKEPNAAAEEYAALLRDKYPNGPDLTLLGIGQDGHTASLFPHSPALHANQTECVANWVEKLTAWRLTMTAQYLNRSFDVLVLAAGKNKSPAVAEALEGMADPHTCPIRLIAPKSGRYHWLLDAPAAGMDADDDPLPHNA